MQRVLFVFDSVNSFKLGSVLSLVGFDVDFLIADTANSRKIKVDNLTDSYIDIIDILSHVELERLFSDKRDYYESVIIYTDKDELNVSAGIFFSKVLRSNFFVINNSINFRFIENALINDNIHILSIENLMWQAIFDFIALRKRQDKLIFKTNNGLKLKIFKYNVLQYFNEIELKSVQILGYLNSDDIFVSKKQKDKQKKLDIALALVMNSDSFEDVKHNVSDNFMQKCVVGLFTDLLPSEVFYKLKVHRIEPSILTDNFFDIKKLKFYYEMNLTKNFSSITQDDFDVIVCYSSDNYENHLKSLYFAQQTNAETLCVTNQGSTLVKHYGSIKSIDVIERLVMWFILEVFAKKFVNLALLSEKHIVFEIEITNFALCDKILNMTHKEIFAFLNGYGCYLLAVCRKNEVFINDLSSYIPEKEDTFLCVFNTEDIKNISEMIS